MKLKLTPELFILQDVASQVATSQDEAKKEERSSSDEPMREEHRNGFQRETNQDRKLKQINRTKRFIETTELLNEDTHHLPANERNQLKQINQRIVESPVYFGQPLEPNVRIIENNGRLALDKRLTVNKRKPKREIIQSDIRCVTLSKEKYGASFGLTIRGGLDFSRPLIIASIQRNSIADKCRSLFLGDLIVELNGQSMYPLRYTHEQAMKIVKTGGNRLYLTVKHLTMYNRPIAKCWQRQMNMSWLHTCDDKIEENWLHYGLSNCVNHTKLAIAKNATQVSDNQFLGNKSSFQESHVHQSSNINQDAVLFADCERYSNCGTATLSDLTVTAGKDDLLTPSPLMNDEGVYTGLSNDALSGSECTSDGSGFSSDYVNSNVHTNHHHSNQTSTYHQSNNKLNCSSSSFCKKNNNSTNCITNKTYPDQTSLTTQPIAQSKLTNNYCNKENIVNDYSFRTNQQVKHTSATPNGNQEMISSCSSFDDGSSISPSINRTSLVDIVSVSLINCYFTKYIYSTDNIRRNGMEVRWLNAHNQSDCSIQSAIKKSMDMNSAVITFNNVELAQQFQQQINHYLAKLNESYMFSFNRGLTPQNRILFMGWISFALPKSSKLNQQPPQTSNLQLSTSLDYNWSPKYMVLKGGEMLLYDCPPDYLLDKIQYANDTLLEFNELSDLLVNKNGTLACSITLNNDLNKPKINTQQSNRPNPIRSSLTRHLSIRGRDHSINKSSIRQSERTGSRFNDPRILTETNNNQQKKSGNRFICTLTRNLSLKTAKENRPKPTTSNKSRSTAHCTFSRNQTIDISSSQFSPDKQMLKRTPLSNDLIKSTEHHLLNQQIECTNEPIVFKAYESVLRQLRPDEQLDRRENCLLALTTRSDNAVSNDSYRSMDTFRKQPSTNHSAGELDSNSNWKESDPYSRKKNSLDSNLNGENEAKTTPVSTQTLVAYLAVEHADNIAQILKSWSVATMHSVIRLSKKSFHVMSEGRYCCLTLDWNAGFTLYDGSNIKWTFKFSQLKNSSDDGSQTLWLSFQSIKHQPVARVQRPNPTLSSFAKNQSNGSLNSSIDSVDQYSQRNRATTPSSFDSGTMNNATMNSTMGNSNQLGSADHLMNNSNYLQTNRNEFRIKKSIETKEIICSNLQHLIFCMHSFMQAKATNCVPSMPNQPTTLNGILV